MKKLIMITTILVLLSGCDDARLAEVADQIAFPTEALVTTTDEAPAAVELLETVPATAAAVQADAASGGATGAPPTAEPSPSPSPTASPEPSPTPPSPEAILGLALHLLDTADSYHFEISSQTTDAGDDPFRLTFAGDFVAPYTLRGEATLALEAELGRSYVVSYDKQYYESPDGDENWRYYPVEPGHLGRADLDALWAQRPYEAGSFSSLTYEGIEELGGKPCYHLQGAVPGSAHMPPVEGDVAVDMLIGVEDGALQRYEAAYEQRLPEVEQVVQVRESYRYSNFNQPAAIDIPAAAIASLPHEEAPLRLMYEAPGDWTAARSGEGCAQGSCPAVTLYRDRPGGPHSTVTLALLSQAERPFMEEVMTPPDYEEREVGGMDARIRQGEAYVDGLIYPDAEHAVQLSARWEGHPEQEAAVWQILDSLASTIPPSPEGFTRHLLPGWGSVDIPDGWHFVNPPAADQMVFSSADVDFTYDTGPEDVLVIMTQLLDVSAMPITILRDEFLPSLEYEWEAVDGPKPLRIGDLSAATVTYHGYEGYTEMLSVLNSRDGRLIAFYATAGEDVWPTYEPRLIAMRDSLQLSPVAEPPQLEPVTERVEGTIVMRDEEQGISFAFPETWQFSQDTADDLVSSYLLVPPGLPEEEIGLVKIYPPSTIIVGEDSAQAELTALGQLDALANWAGDLTIRDALRTSWTSTYRGPSREYAAGYYVATKNGRPIYGFMGAMTDGEAALKLIAWFEDPEEYKDEVLAIFNSLQLAQAPDLHRDTAAPLQPGVRQDGTITGQTDQFYAFEARSGQQYMIISQVNAADPEALASGLAEFDTSVFDPQGQPIAFQPAISLFYSGLTVFTAEQSGQHIVTVRPFEYYGPIPYTLYLLKVGEGVPGTAQATSGTILGSCMGYLVAEPEGELFAIHAALDGPQAEETTLSVAVLDSTGGVRYECGEYCAQTGQPTTFLYTSSGDEAFTVSVCELNDQPAEFELIIATIPD